jgi:hypothetical protein
MIRMNSSTFLKLHPMIFVLSVILFVSLVSCESGDSNNLIDGDAAYATSNQDNESAFCNATYKDGTISSLFSEYSKNATVTYGTSSHLDTSSSDMKGFLPTPGSWSWGDLGGSIASNAFQVKDNLARVHNLVKGGDNGLWDNVDGTWLSLGGALASDPYAVKDGTGKIHVLVKGGDGALWDRILDGGWTNLGGAITSKPSAALSANDVVKIAVRGSDNSVWLKDLTTGSWTSLGGYIDSNPQVIFDVQGNLHVLTKGGDGALWDNVNGIWQNRGGSITSDAMPVINPLDTRYVYVFARGGDGGLWCNALDTTTNTATWQNRGGFISTSSIGLYKGKPDPAVDPDGVLHTFIRGGDGGLWDNANGIWYSLGGSTKSDPNALRDKNGKLRAAIVGADNRLWINTLGLEQPSTILVGPIACDYKKIQSAVDAASTDSVIKVMSGIYKENVVVENYINPIMKLSIRGNGSANTVVDGQNSGSTFKVGLWDRKTELTLSGMTIQDGSGTPVQVGSSLFHRSGGGIFNQLAEINLVDCLISGNNAEDGGGIYNFKGTVNLDRTSIDSNTATYYGGGVLSYGPLNLNSGSISNNIAFSGGGVLTYGTFNMWGGSISYNQADTAVNGEGGGIHATYEPGISGGVANVYGGSIDHNQARWGGGIFSYSILNIYGGTIDSNSATNGGGIDNAWSVTNINGGDISNNVASQSGGGIFDEKDGIINFRDARIFGNAAEWGGGITNFGGTVNLISGSIDHNTAKMAAPSGGGIGSCQPSSEKGDRDIVHDNTPDNIYDSANAC